eukprot:Plantae.Rhodophyta-Purpureofilum_apyrenoidigerum.ctg23418.p1 GENE.Plantae.Rhodophyta-Purpureofilum_apyrenoidigerum.ctg23418~~Plantae.Rhodophyta-Purpureofilum_apyrenoidigerum.ctg23418.p1  ORF type:complete len:585 (-),score=101.98 Plantae.Rhodophyta-Purpureofilum_apyrenoidigerum.ctg23418:359-1987(-)
MEGESDAHRDKENQEQGSEVKRDVPEEETEGAPDENGDEEEFGQDYDDDGEAAEKENKNMVKPEGSLISGKLDRPAGYVPTSKTMMEISKQGAQQSCFTKHLIPDKENAKSCACPMIKDWATVGEYPSPLKVSHSVNNFVSNHETVLVDIVAHSEHETVSREFARAGPREYIAFHPKTAKVCIVTCGGLCPGLNTVVREIFFTLYKRYGVEEIYGIPFGYQGFYSEKTPLRRLTKEIVNGIHYKGGTFLGSSRGGHDTNKIVDAIEKNGFRQVYIIGGDGSHRGALKIFEEVRRRGLKVAVIGVPKTIDNDIPLIDKSFGFDTAVEESQRAIRSGVVEAKCGINGIGLVKLMGRHAGWISVYATLSNRDVDFCLIPEIPFELDGPLGLYQTIYDCIKRKGNCVIVVAEGAGMNHMENEAEQQRDESGNVKMQDIGLFLKAGINRWFARNKIEVNLKYIDPTYMIRTVSPNAGDSLTCAILAQNAVHGAMAGFSGFSAGLINTHNVMIPIHTLVNTEKRTIDEDSRMWQRILDSTGQPSLRSH